MRKLKKIFLIAAISGVVFAPLALAQDNSLIGGQSPSVTLGQIFDPVEKFIGWISGFIENIILHLFDWDWIRKMFTGLFGAIDGWGESITGNNLGEIFRIIGNTLSEVFYFVLNFLKSLWPF